MYVCVYIYILCNSYIHILYIMLHKLYVFCVYYTKIGRVGHLLNSRPASRPGRRRNEMPRSRFPGAGRLLVCGRCGRMVFFL